MTNYSPKNFFRKAPKNFLQQYFTQKNVLADFDFESVSPSNVDSIHDAWLALPDKERMSMEQDFQDIFDLGSEAGSKAILDEANFFDTDLAGAFSELNGYFEHAFWTFLEKHNFLEGALMFFHADSLPTSHWRKRKNVPMKSADVSHPTIAKFEQALGAYFHKKEGRGKNCKVDTYKRNDLDYYFAYPEDYSHAPLEWEGSQIKRRAHRPAFEVILVYSQKDGTLDVYLKGDRKLVPDLQALFAEIILQENLGDDEKDERIYDLERLRSRSFEFQIPPELGIESVSVKKMRLNVSGTKERITLESDPTVNAYAIWDLLEKLTKNSPHLHYKIGQVGLKVKFRQSPSSKRANTRSFDVTWPNACSIKQEGRDLKIRQMLALSGIEPQTVAKTDGVAA